MTLPIWLVKKHPKNYVFMASHRSEVTNAPSNNFIRVSSVCVVETELYENVTETFSLDVVASSTDWYVLYDVLFRCGLKIT